MKLKEIKELTVDELQARKRELSQSAFHLRLQQKTGQLEKPSEIRLIRREVARIETVLSERRLSAASKA